jgi:hypothetical protein
MRTWDDAWHDYPDEMLFNLKDDPHEQHDLSETRAELASQGREMLSEWSDAMTATARGGVDPFATVLAEGGSLHGREGGARYLDYLRHTGRAHLAERLERKRREAARWP